MIQLALACFLCYFLINFFHSFVIFKIDFLDVQDFVVFLFPYSRVLAPRNIAAIDPI